MVCVCEDDVYYIIYTRVCDWSHKVHKNTGGNNTKSPVSGRRGAFNVLFDASLTNPCCTLLWPNLSILVAAIGFKQVMAEPAAPADPYNILEVADKLSQHQIDELTARPLGHDGVLTPEQWAVRTSIGKHIAKAAYKHALEMDAVIASMYLKYPPYLFYTNSDGAVKRRVYGWAKCDDDSIRAHAVTALIGFNNDVIGGVPVEELVPLTTWSPEHVDFLNSGLVVGRGMFLDPLGFMMMSRSDDE